MKQVMALSVRVAQSWPDLMMKRKESLEYYFLLSVVDFDFFYFMILDCYARLSLISFCLLVTPIQIWALAHHPV